MHGSHMQRMRQTTCSSRCRCAPRRFCTSGQQASRETARVLSYHRIRQCWLDCLSAHKAKLNECMLLISVCTYSCAVNVHFYPPHNFTPAEAQDRCLKQHDELMGYVRTCAARCSPTDRGPADKVHRTLFGGCCVQSARACSHPCHVVVTRPFMLSVRASTSRLRSTALHTCTHYTRNPACAAASCV